MKIKIFVSAILSFSFCLLSSQVPQGFNYMAIARNGSGVLANQDLTVKIAILTGIPGEYTVLWEERHAVRTNNDGLFRLVVGDPNAERLETSTVTNFSDIDWHIQPMYIRTMINEFEMGISPLFSVPYALLAKDIEGPVNKLGVEGKTDLMDEALFEVKNKDGQIVFAVYNEGVRIYVDDAGTKAAKGGFAIGSFGSTSKDGNPGQDYFKVNPGVINAYIDDTPGKAAKGGFAIGGFGSKSDPSNYLQVDIDKIKAGKVDYLDITDLNTFIGSQAGHANATGQYNSFMGYNAGLLNSSGGSNVFIGNESGRSNKEGSSNVFLGFNAGYTNDASYNSFIGYQAGRANLSGEHNTFLGYNAGLSNSSGSNNLFIGYESGKLNSTGHDNIFLGKNSGLNSNGNYNILIGLEAGLNATGDDNVFVGVYAGRSLTSGLHNVLIGSSAGYNHTTQDYNVMIGTNAGYHLNDPGWAASFNTFVGINSGYKIASGKENVFIGTNSGYWIENGTGNTIVGIDAGNSGGSDHNLGYNASSNTIMGDKAGYNILDGDNNVMIGYNSGHNLASGSGNVFLGNQAGSLETGSNKLYIGNSSYFIHGQPVGPDNPGPPLIYGDFSTGNIGLGTTTIPKRLNVSGDADVSGILTAGSVNASITGNVTGNVTGDVTGNITGNVSGDINGITMGKIYLTGHGGTIATTAGGTFTLTWDADGNWIQLENTNAAQCNWWYYLQNYMTPTTGSTGAVPASSNRKIITQINANDNTGFEIHFGRADGPDGWCSVWLQYSHGAMVGHYMKY